MKRSLYGHTHPIIKQSLLSLQYHYISSRSNVILISQYLSIPLKTLLVLSHKLVKMTLMIVLDIFDLTLFTEHHQSITTTPANHQWHTVLHAVCITTGTTWRYSAVPGPALGVQLVRKDLEKKTSYSE